MRKTLLTTLAVAAIFSSGTLGHRARAMTFATPSGLGLANSDAATIQKATVVCGTNGCAPVQTRRVQHPSKPHRI